MRKGIILIVSLLLLLGMSACEDNQADFHGVILEVHQSSIVVGTADVEPGASYPSFEVVVNDQTKITGALDEFSDLKTGQEVNIWVKGPWNHKPDNTLVAQKIAAFIN